jgi:hypothetical protein
MQKVFSARVDEAVLNEMDRATRRLRMSKRQFLEEAIQMRAEVVSRDEQGDIWDETLGAWNRRESATTTIRRARHAVRQSFTRHQGAGRARVRR